MASIVSKLARAAVASRASLAAVGGCSRPVSPCHPRLIYLTGRRMCSGVVTPEGKEYHIEIGGPIPEEAQRALTVTEETLKSDEALWAMYEFWCRYHGVSRDRAEMHRRFEIFKSTARSVYETNNSGASFKAGMNPFADMTMEEINRKYSSPLVNPVPRQPRPLSGLPYVSSCRKF